MAERKILIIDDNIFESIAVKGMFEQYQFDSDLAPNGLEALAMVQARLKCGGPEKMYKLIMMDYQMPVTDGADSAIMILDYLREEKLPEANMPYIVCMSNFSYGISINEKFMKTGMDEFVCKPIFKLGIYRLLVQARLLKEKVKQYEHLQ